MSTSSTIFVGIKGCVMALDRAMGTEVWNTHLKGGDFVNVLFVDGDLYAATKGELFCLDVATGQVRWHNPLKGYGWGLITIAAPGVPENQAVAARMKRLEKERAAAAAAAAS